MGLGQARLAAPDSIIGETIYFFLVVSRAIGGRWGWGRVGPVGMGSGWTGGNGAGANGDGARPS